MADSLFQVGTCQWARWNTQYNICQLFVVIKDNSILLQSGMRWLHVMWLTSCITAKKKVVHHDYNTCTVTVIRQQHQQTQGYYKALIKRSTYSKRMQELTALSQEFFSASSAVMRLDGSRISIESSKHRAPDGRLHSTWSTNTGWLCNNSLNQSCK